MLDELLKRADDILKQNKTLIDLLPDLNQYNETDWQKYEIYNDEKYNKNIVCSSDYADLYIICWKKNQESKIHDHSDNGCSMKILKGKLSENRYVNMKTHCGETNDVIKFISSRIIQKNQLSYNHGSKNIHKIIALEDSVSLHIYPKYYVMTTYECK